MKISRKDLGWVLDGDCKMNRSTKVSLVSSIFVITGLCGSLSYAAPEVKDKYEHHVTMADAGNQRLTMNNTSIKNITDSFAYPSITSEVFIENRKTAIQPLSNVLRRPLQGILVADFAHITPNRFQKKNAIFEFSAKFNDKLQQIIAIFDVFSTKTVTKKENIHQKSAQRKVHLSSNIGSCISSKK
jgi:hypothetical protein